MNIVHLVVVKNSFYISESGRSVQKTDSFSLILGTKNLVNIGTQQQFLYDGNSQEIFPSTWVVLQLFLPLYFTVVEGTMFLN